MDLQTLKRFLIYDPLTGIFTRRVGTGKGASRGAIAGTLTPHGYISISIQQKRYMAHRLAWLWMTGAYIETGIDHIDMNKANNVFENLRLADKRLNAGNVNKHKDNTSGYKGVNEYRIGKWRASIGYKGKQIHIGTYNSAEEAHNAYCNKAKEIFGEYWRE